MVSASTQQSLLIDKNQLVCCWFEKLAANGHLLLLCGNRQHQQKLTELVSLLTTGHWTLLAPSSDGFYGTIINKNPTTGAAVTFSHITM